MALEDLTRFSPNVCWMIASWLIALASWMGIDAKATRLQRVLCATTLLLALTTIAEGAALAEVLLLMLWVVLATVVRWLGLEPRAFAPHRDDERARP